MLHRLAQISYSASGYSIMKPDVGFGSYFVSLTLKSIPQHLCLQLGQGNYNDYDYLEQGNQI